MLFTLIKLMSKSSIFIFTNYCYFRTNTFFCFKKNKSG